MRDAPPVWLFDRDCVLCSGAVRYVLGHERASPPIRFVAIRSGEGRTLAERHGIDPDNPETFLFVDGGRALAKSDGVIALARRLNGPARVLALGRFVPRWLRDPAYDLVARTRYRIFGRKENCIVPSPEERDRFVLS